MRQTWVAAGAAVGMWLAGGAAAHAEVLAYWAFNDTALGDGTFGFTPASFPLAADLGSGSLTLTEFLTTTDANGAYTSIASFEGTTDNAQPDVVAGRSLSPQGGASNGNNGMSVVLSLSTTGFEQLQIAWVQRGTSTGFTTRTLSYSLDGDNYTIFDGDEGALTATWVPRAYDLSSVTALDNQTTVYLRITLNGATGVSGNNRIDNLTVTGTALPPSASEPLASSPWSQGGDVTGNGAFNAADVLCVQMAVLLDTCGGGPAPACLQGPATYIDFNCDGTCDQEDVEAARLGAIGAAFGGAVDSTGSGVPDLCESN